MSETPRIYVACLASYNAGHLFGEWFDADDGAEYVAAQVADMIKKSPASDAEEYAIHDSENFYGFTVGEYSPLSEVCQAAELIVEHGAAFGAACSAFDNLQEAIRAMDYYAGAWDSAADYAEETADDSGIPDHFRGYIDWESYARDLNLTEVRIGNEIHLFTEH